jgi:hypothetical protein
MPPLDHRRQQGSRDSLGAEVVDLHLAPGPGRILAQKHALLEHAGVVDDRIERTGGEDLGCCGFDRRVRADVEPDDLSRRAERRDLARDLA